MKQSRIAQRVLCVLSILFTLCVSVKAQNVLKAGDISCMKSVSVDMPFFLENINPNVVALQFEVTVPQDVTINTSSATAQPEITRATDHQIRIASLGNRRYRVMMLSPTNTPLRANKGKVLSLCMSVASAAALQEGESYPVTLSNVVISNDQGVNVMTAYEAGSITLEPCPDFTVSDISITSGDVSPEGTVSLAWTINNIGTRDSQGGWSEQITFISDNTGETFYLTTMHYTDPLNAGQSVTRTADVAVPRIVGIDGPFHVQIKVVPNSDSGESVEYQNNNTAISTASYNMLKTLYLTLYQDDMYEDPANRTYSCMLERSGSRAEALTFTLDGPDTPRLVFPTSLTIERNSATKHFNIQVLNDDILNGDEVVYVFGVMEANGYNQAAQSIRVIDDDMPTLTVSPNPTNINEGDDLTLTITASHPNTKDVVIKLSCEQPERFPNMPTSVTLPAGDTEVVVHIPGYDDDDINLLHERIAFTASATRYHQGQGYVTIEDNDMPTLSMTLSKTTVYENEGRHAILCTITRSVKMNSVVTIRLTDDGNRNLNYSPNVITLKKNQETAEFYIGVNDDGEMQGSRHVTFNATVYVKSCGCDVSAELGGVMSETITIYDNDSPHFTLRSVNSNLLEGSMQNEFILSRNNSALAVEAHITCSEEGAVVLPASVTIPEGQNEVSFNVAVNTNEVSGDTRRVKFTATGDPDSNHGSAKNYGSATCTAMITDQTLPDLEVIAMGISDNVAVGEKIGVTVDIKNSGYEEVGSFRVRFDHGTMKQIELFELKEPLAPGQVLHSMTNVTAMDVAGTYTMKVTADPFDDVVELDKLNNTMSTEVVINPLFTATAFTDKAIYNNTETVHIHGKATGLHPNNADLDVYVINGGMRFVVQTKTDENGNYTADWTPEGNLAGHFIVGACTRGEDLKREMATFEMYGMRRYDTGFVLSEFEVGETKDGYFDIINHGSMTLHNIEASIENMPINAYITIDPVSRLRPGNHARVFFHWTGNHPSPDVNEWESAVVHLECEEGSVFDQKIYFYVHSPVPVLKADVTTINTTMTPGKIREIPITIRNEGRQETGPITLDMPNLDWLKLGTPVKMASLKQGEEATVVLQLTPSSAMAFHSITTGQFAINYDNNTRGITIPFRVETVSEETGTLVIDVWDEFTTNTPEAPHVEGATVNVLHPVTQKLIRQAVTGADGLATFELLDEGNYLVSVTHPKHSSWKQNVMVDPDRTSKYRAFIEYSAITVEMHYEKTEIEDEYEIVTTVTYETNVPKPVVLLEAPKKIILDEIRTPYLYYAHLTNVGLVTAFDVTYHVPSEVNGYRFTPLIENAQDILPQQTISIPVEITKIEESEEEEAEARATGPMFLPKPGQQAAPRRDPGVSMACGIEQMAKFFANCGTGGDGAGNVGSTVSSAMQVSSKCGGGGPGDVPYIPSLADPGSPGSGGGGSGGGGSGAYEMGGGGGGVASCDPYLQEYGKDIIKDLLGNVPGVGPAFGGLPTLGGLTKKGAVHMLKKALKDWDDYIKWGKKIWDLGEAMFKSRSTSFIDDEDDGAASTRRRVGPKRAYVWEDESGNEQKGTYGDLMAYYNGVMKSLWLQTERGRQRTGMTDVLDEPLYFSNYLFDEDKPVGLGNIENPDWFPSPMRAWNNNLVPGYYTYYHNLLVLHEIFGEWGFVFFDQEHMQALADSIASVKNNPDIDLSREQDRKKVFDMLYNEVIPNDYIPMATSYQYISYYPREYMVNRIINTLRVENGEILSDDRNYMDPSRVELLQARIQKGLMEVNRAGYEDEGELMGVENQKLLDYLSQPRNSICSSVKLQIEQKMTMTREAVRGTLTVVNGSEYESMRDVKLNLTVTDAEGNVADSHIMEITTEGISGFTGALDFESGWTLAPKGKGIAKILFIPTRFAAPDEPVQYTFAGTISFTDPFTGLSMTRALEEERLTVNPSPVLDLTYLMQRDILGDDALTEEVEPVVPSQFTLLINNKGKGDATKVKMVTNQPEVVDNEKGLLVGIQIASSQLNGGDKTLALGKSVATDFGTIKAGTSALAQWWMTSSLTGHFTDYDVAATHVTSYDNPDLTLLDQVTIHEMIHQILLPGVENTSDGTFAPENVAFLVNDEEDYHDAPDQLYTVDGGKTPVGEATDIRWQKVSDTRYILSVKPKTAGWCYGNTTDPTGGQQNIKTVQRNSDVLELPADNFWQTDRTLVDRMEPVYENLIHFADEMPLTGETYTIDFEPKPVTPLELVSFSGVPDKDAFTQTAVGEVVVAFDRPINESTFTPADLTLTRAGEPLDLSGLTIVKESEQAFSFDLTSLTTMDGYYLLTVQMADITDADGVAGTEGRTIGWTQVEDGKANLIMVVEPAGAGTVTPGNSRQKFFGEVALTATPNTGYNFSGWKEGDQLLSTEANYTYAMFGQKTVTAVFTPQQYRQNVDWNPVRGTVMGGGSGFYDYGTEVTWTPVPNDGYYFAGWRVGSMYADVTLTDPVLNFTVTGQSYYFADFEPVQYVDIDMSENNTDNTSFFAEPHGKYFMVSSDRQLKNTQWNPVCFPFAISEQEVNKLWGYATMIVRLTSVDGDRMNFDYQYDIKAGVPYLVRPERTVAVPQFMLNGDNIHVVEEPIADSYGDFHFVGNYTPHVWNTENPDGVEKYYGVTQEKLVEAKSNTAALKGLRGYFVVPAAAGARLCIGGIETAIDEVVSEEYIIGQQRIYNLQGQYLGDSTEGLPKGLYIINGKKQIVK